MNHLEPRDIEVLLLAAGYGKRLGSLTAQTPKPLLKVAGKTLIERNLELISRSGFRRVFINLHYRGEEIERYVAGGERWGLTVRYSKEPIILDTGGAIKQISSLLATPLLVTVNSDIVIGDDFSLASLVAAHQHNKARPLATLLVRKDSDAPRYGEIGVNSSQLICSFLGRDYAPPIARGLMYTGIQVLSAELWPFMPPAGTVFSITRDTYVDVLEKSRGPLASVEYSGVWNDVGTPERLAASERLLLSPR